MATINDPSPAIVEESLEAKRKKTKSEDLHQSKVFLWRVYNYSCEQTHTYYTHRRALWHYSLLSHEDDDDFGGEYCQGGCLEDRVVASKVATEATNPFRWILLDRCREISGA